MFTLKIDFKCPLCENKDKWYCMPLKEQTKSKDFIRSLDKFELVCKKCSKSYFLSFKIKAI